MHSTYQTKRISWKLVAFIALFILLLSNIPSAPARAANPAAEPATAAQAKKKCSQEGEFKEVPGQGRSCRLANGLWKVKLKNGSSVLTHGPDPAPKRDEVAIAPIAAPATDVKAAPSAAAAAVCVPTSDYHNVLIYAVASDRANRYGTMANTIRGYFQWAQNKLSEEGAEFGVSMSYKMACNADNTLRVDNVQLGITFAQSNFSNIISNLRSKGYNNTRAKYWVWYDGAPVPGACGQGTLFLDDRGSADNYNNGGNMFGISYGCDGHAMMHENGHNIGAVQNSAPGASGNGHCNEGRDVMCYADGGSTSAYNPNVCTDREHFDCRHDSYFHPNPPAGSYLATKWNAAACYNRFISRSGCGGTTPPPPPPPGNAAGIALVNRNSEKCMDVNGGTGATGDGANIHQWSCTYATNQQWELRAAGDGTYYLIAKHSGKAADINACGTADGTNIQQWTLYNNACQKFRFEHMGEAYYRLVNPNSGKCVDVASSGTADGTNIRLWTCNGSNAQSWRLVPVGDLRIESKNSGKVLDVSGGSTADGANVQIWNYAGVNQQRWRFEHVGGGWLRIVARHSGKCLEVATGNTADGANVQQWSCAAVAHHHWRVDPTGDGFFRLIARHSGKVADVAYCGTADGTNVAQVIWHNNDCQRFALKTP